MHIRIKGVWANAQAETNSWVNVIGLGRAYTSNDFSKLPNKRSLPAAGFKNNSLACSTLEKHCFQIYNAVIKRLDLSFRKNNLAVMRKKRKKTRVYSNSDYRSGVPNSFSPGATSALQLPSKG